VPLSFPKKIVPSLITGEDFVPAPVARLHNSFGSDEISTQIFRKGQAYHDIQASH